MKRLTGVVLLVLSFLPCLWADTEDTVVFRTRMAPENEVPPLTIPGASAAATITIRVTRDGRGAITAATVVFDLSITTPQSITFIALHIHNARAGVNGPVVIASGLSGANPVIGTGRITRTTNYASTDTSGLRFVTGLLESPELYYVNIHSTVYPGGVLRGQLQRNRIFLRPALSPANEVPAVTGLDAEGAALITISVNRDAAGTITSGVVTFDVDYRFASSANIVGINIHKGAAGTNGPVVISSGISSANAITSTSGRENTFRAAEIDSSNLDGLATLTSLMADPSQFYVNFQTAANPSGAIRGQLEKDVLNFLSLMEGSQEVPPVPIPASANALTSVRVNRDGAGNISGGTVTFNVNYSIPGGAVTLIGLHIHPAKFGVNGPVTISSALPRVVDDDGIGSITRQATIAATNTVGLSTLYGLFADPESFYINMHSTIYPGGVVRAQLGRETYRFRPALRPGNQIPAVTSTATGTAWLTVTVNRNASGTITSGSVLFDVDFNIGGPATIVGLQLHRGSSAENGPVVIDSGISSSSPLASDTGTGNVTRTAGIASTDTSGLAALADLINLPGGYYLNLRTTANPDGLLRSQVLQFVNFVTQVAGGGDWISSVTITNSSTTASAQGLIKFFDTNGNPMPPTITDPTIAFWIPPAGSATFNTHNKGALASGIARVHSNTPVTVDVGYLFPGLASPGRARSVAGRAVSIPVSVGSGGVQNTGIALVSLENTEHNVLFTLRDSGGALIAGGIQGITLPPGKHVVGFVSQLLPSVTQAQFSGTLTLEMRRAFFSSGTMSVLAIQFDASTMTPVPVTVLQ